MSALEQGPCIQKEKIVYKNIEQKYCKTTEKPKIKKH